MKTLEQEIEDRDAFLHSLPTEKRLELERQTWVLEQKLRKYKDPIARMNAMVRIFWEGVAEFQETLERVL